MSYVDLVDIKAYIGGISGDGDDALLEDLVSAAEAFIEGETHRDFEVSADATKYFDALYDVDGPYLTFGDLDVCSLTTVTNGDSVVVSSSEYVTEPRHSTPYYAIKLKGSAGKSWTYTTDHENAITVTGKFGYSTTPPEDIKQAVRDIVKTVYRSRDANAQTGDIIITGGMVIQPADIPGATRRTLARYRRF